MSKLMDKPIQFKKLGENTQVSIFNPRTKTKLTEFETKTSDIPLIANAIVSFFTNPNQLPPTYGFISGFKSGNDVIDYVTSHNLRLIQLIKKPYMNTWHALVFGVDMGPNLVPKNNRHYMANVETFEVNTFDEKQDKE